MRCCFISFNKVYMKKYLLDQMSMLFSYENRKKKILINFSSPRLRRIKSVKFHFWLGKIPRKTGDTMAVTSIKQRLVSGFLNS